MPTNEEKVVNASEVRALVASGFSDWRELVRVAVRAYERRCAHAHSYIVPIPDRHARDEIHNAHVQRVWEEFWVPVFEGIGLKVPGPHDAVTLTELNEFLEQVKKELYDCHTLMHNCSVVYDNATGGRVSKPLTDPYVVSSLVEERVQEDTTTNVYDWLEVVETEMGEKEQLSMTIAEIKQSVEDNFGPMPTYG